MRKNRTFLFVCFLAIATVIVVSFYFTPHLAVYNMKKAAEKKDAEALSRYVDYSSLRESLNANVNAMMAGEITKSDNPFEALGAALGAALVNPMIDAFITPESLAMLIKGEAPQMGDSEKGQKTGSASETKAKTSMSYRGLNQFVVKVKEKGSSEEPIELIYKRSGIVSWKLSALRLPSLQSVGKASSSAQAPQMPTFPAAQGQAGDSTVLGASAAPRTNDADAFKRKYISESLLLEDVRVDQGYGQFDVPGYSEAKRGVFGTIKNVGDRTLKRVDIRVYFLDSGGARVGEKEITVLSTGSIYEPDPPLKPNYSKDFGYILEDDASKEWAGKVELEISGIEFANPQTEEASRQGL